VNETGRCGPAGDAPAGGVAAWASTNHNPSKDHDPPEPAKGGELVLKFSAFTQAFAVDALRRREDGQTMAEYGVVLAVITLAVVAAVTLLSTNVQNAMENVAGLFPG
jgi:Flp pilus assembly pilin Flp